MSERITAGLTRASDTKEVLIGRGVLSQAGARIVEQLGFELLLVADENTMTAAGDAVLAGLLAAGAQVETLTFPGNVYADYANAVVVKERLVASGSARAVAVGSGTINDLVKAASGEAGRPYAVVGTAASMDGYSGFGASLGIDGTKVTFPCPAPALVLIDLDVAAAAPAEMVASGYGDLMAKVPAGADWILADTIGFDPIDPFVWNLVQGGLSAALADPEGLAASRPEAFAELVEGLIMSGIAMQVYQGSRPASGAEHYFSHLWELAHLGADRVPPLSHGFKVAIGTVAMSAFYERFLARDFGRVDVDRAVAAWQPWDELAADIRRKMPNEALADKGLREMREKYTDAAGLHERLTTLAIAWPELRPRLIAQLRPARELMKLLAAVGAPARPEEIGLTPAEVKATFWPAMYYRSRYTVLDLARELGWFDELVDEVFAELWT